jgi:hypothetical protein
METGNFFIRGEAIPYAKEIFFPEVHEGTPGFILCYGFLCHGVAIPGPDEYFELPRTWPIENDRKKLLRGMGSYVPDYLKRAIIPDLALPPNEYFFVCQAPGTFQDCIFGYRTMSEDECVELKVGAREKASKIGWIEIFPDVK